MMHNGEIKRFLLHTKRAQGIARRYFVTNGFDGALTLLGLMVGFISSDNVPLPIAIKASLGAAIALCMSGLSSAYLSETAERKHELQELEKALLSDLSESDYGKASKYVPILVALVNGLSPLIIALLIITPLWLAEAGMLLPVSPFIVAIILALFIIFMLGTMLGKLSNEFWLWTGLRTLAIGGLTVFIISIF